MNFYKQLVFPRLARLDPEQAHERALEALERAQSVAGGRAMLRSIAGRIPWRPVRVAGLHFPHVLGLAAGFDKDVRVAAALAELGWGHIEAGTLTPREQSGNPRPRIFRIPAHRALVNRMGFPNEGIEAALPRLRQLARSPRRWVLGLSLGKQKETPLEDAAGDYIAVLRRAYPYADYFAANVSSPNTPGLRALQGREFLRDLMGQLTREGARLARRGWLARRPIFVKIAPDLTPEELRETVEAALEAGVDGIIATNTTLQRGGIKFEEEGGLSGSPLASRSTEIVAQIRRLAGSRVPIIAVGGVSSAAGVREKLQAGAHLVQIYTAFVYEGPGLPGHLLRDLQRQSR